jgi:hypothetical protein
VLDKNPKRKRAYETIKPNILQGLVSTRAIVPERDKIALLSVFPDNCQAFSFEFSKEHLTSGIAGLAWKYHLRSNSGSSGPIAKDCHRFLVAGPFNFWSLARETHGERRTANECAIPL